jgi:uncharacterized protein (TIGR02145 family)
MTIWSGEIQELDKLYTSFKGHLPDIVKEMEQLIRTDDANVVMLYARRCLEVIVTDLCETELKRPRKTEPLKGIIDKLNSEEKVPSHIITSMHGLNSMSTYGTHPKDFDPEQVKPVLNNLAIIIRWYLKYKNFHVVSNTKPEQEILKSAEKSNLSGKLPVRKKRSGSLLPGLVAGVVITLIVFLLFKAINKRIDDRVRAQELLSKTGYFTDPRDNQKYKTIEIGNQVWMGENLKAVLYNDGTPIPLVTDSAEWNYLKTPGYCWYDNQEVIYKEQYGALYNWYTVNTGKLCPAGWHVPSDAEWTILTDFLGGESVAGNKLKEEGYSHWPNSYDKRLVPTNESGFTALPGGFRGCNEVQGFESIGYNCSWWSSDGSDNKGFSSENNFAWRRRLEAEYKGVFRDDATKQVGFSVRCIKDK